MTGEKLKCAKAPCKSCPYRKDAPSGLWEAHEYHKLPAYDGEIVDQLMGGGRGLFMCHQQDGCLCAGWVGAHGPHDLLALRLQADRVDPSVWSYESPVPLFGSGREAADHGLRDVEDMGLRAVRMAARLKRKQQRRRRYGR